MVTTLFVISVWMLLRGFIKYISLWLVQLGFPLIKIPILIGNPFSHPLYLEMIFSFIILIINVIAGVYFINLYGVMGAAYTTVALMWLAGIFSLLALIYFVFKSK